MSARPWTTTDERLLRDWYPRVGAAECAQMLGRSVGAVWTRAYRLGLTEKDPALAQRFAAHTGRTNPPRSEGGRYARG